MSYLTMSQLDASETARRLPYADLVRSIARAARELANGALKAPERLVIELGTGASLLCMPAVASDIGIAKIIRVRRSKATNAAPAIQGEVIVFDSSTGEQLMVLDGPTVTARRTAAVTLLAIERLASVPPRSALIIGTGVQAAAHVDALLEYFDLRSLWVAGTQLDRAAAFCDVMRSRHEKTRINPRATASDFPGADVVIALTNSKTPVIPSQLPDATLAIGVGAFRPDMAEIPALLLRNRRIVVDYLNGAKHEAGDLLQAAIDWSDVSELSEVLDSRSFAESHTPIVFKSVGHASWDLAAARVALQMS